MKKYQLKVGKILNLGGVCEDGGYTLLKLSEGVYLSEYIPENGIYNFTVETSAVEPYVDFLLECKDRYNLCSDCGPTKIRQWFSGKQEKITYNE